MITSLTIDPDLVLRFTVTAVMVAVAIAAVIVTLAREGRRRAEDRNTLLETILDRHGINYPKGQP